MTDPVVRARELAALINTPNEEIYNGAMAEAFDTLPVLCDIIDELRVALLEAVEKNDTYKTDGHRRHCRYCGMYEQYSHLYTCPIQMLADLSVTPETQ